MKRILRFALWALLVVVVLGGLAVVGLRLWAPHREKAAERAWAESFESMEVLRARYPDTPDSPAALELVARAGRLGIAMRPSAPAPPDVKSATSAVDASREEAKRLHPLVSFVGEQGAKADDEGLEAPPEAVADFLSRMSGEIEAVETHLVGPEPVVWAVRIGEGFDAPYPSLAGYRYLQGVLLARALEAARRGDGPAAQQALGASWKLNLSLRERPELISQLVAIAMGELHNGVVRRVAAAPAEWAERLASHDWRSALLRSYQMEALQFTITARKGWPPSPVDGSRAAPAHPAWSLASRLFLEASLADYSWQMRRMAADARQQDPCSIDVVVHSRRAEEAIPRWNVIARIAMPSFARSWASAGRAALGDELTRLVVQARAHAHAPEANAPLPATVPSSACAGLSWAIKTTPGGDIQIEADRNPFKDAKLAPLLAFRVHRAPALARAGRKSGAAQGRR